MVKCSNPLWIYLNHYYQTSMLFSLDIYRENESYDNPNLITNIVVLNTYNIGEWH